MKYTVEISAAQMKFLQEFFENYSDDLVKMTLKDSSNRVKHTYFAESDLDVKVLENHLKETFKSKGKMASALYYTINIK